MTAKDLQARAGLALLLEAEPLEGGSSYSFPYPRVDDPKPEVFEQLERVFERLADLAEKNPQPVSILWPPVDPPWLDAAAARALQA